MSTIGSNPLFSLALAPSSMEDGEGWGDELKKIIDNYRYCTKDRYLIQLNSL